jgi:hypothetical protein
MLFNFFMILLLDSGRPTFGRGSAACRHGQSLPPCRSSLSVTVADGFGLPDLMNRYEQATIPGRVMLIYINATQAYVFAGSAFPCRPTRLRHRSSKLSGSSIFTFTAGGAASANASSGADRAEVSPGQRNSDFERLLSPWYQHFRPSINR